MVTPWSPDWLDRSPVRSPSSRMSTRSPSKPRMIGAARSGAEAAARDARLTLQGVAEAAGRCQGDVKRVEGGDRVECLERRLGSAHRGGHGHVLVDGSKLEHEVQRRRRTGLDGHHLPGRGQVLALREHLVRARQHAVDLKHPLFVGQCEGARANDEDHRAMDGVPGLFQRHGATHRAGLLRRHPG